MAATQHTGRCACGAVTYTVTGQLTDVIACHCETCRRASGYYWGATHVDKNALSINNNDTLRWWQSSDFAQRGFCSHCGSSLFYSQHAAAHIAIAPGSLDDTSSLSTTSHIFCSESGDYYKIDEHAWCYPLAAPQEQ